jgi:hypothetical protein
MHLPILWLVQKGLVALTSPCPNHSKNWTELSPFNCKMYSIASSPCKEPVLIKEIVNLLVTEDHLLLCWGYRNFEHTPYHWRLFTTRHPSSGTIVLWLTAMYTSKGGRQLPTVSLPRKWSHSCGQWIWILTNICVLFPEEENRLIVVLHSWLRDNQTLFAQCVKRGDIRK